MTNTQSQLDVLIVNWHKAITSRDVDALMRCYTDDAVIESSAVLVLEKDTGGTLHGKPALRKHFQAFFDILEPSDADWFRYPPVAVTDSLLLWEYPSRGPDGDQLDVVESFTVDDGLINYHRVYWGWRGFQLLDTQR